MNKNNSALLETLKDQLIKKATQKYVEIEPIGFKGTFANSFTMFNGLLIFWFNTKDNSTHVEQTEYNVSIKRHKPITSNKGGHMSDSMKNAFLKTEKGEMFIMQAKQEKIAEKIRFQQLKSLVHDTFVVYVPKGKAKRWDVYQNSHKTVMALAKQGGATYNNAMLLVRHAHSSYDCKRRKYSLNIQKRNYRDAITVLGC